MQVGEVYSYTSLYDKKLSGLITDDYQHSCRHIPNISDKLPTMIHSQQ